MTLRDVRPFARLVADWCLAQDDLVGFHVELMSTRSLAWLQVALFWSNGRVTSRQFGLHSLNQFRDPQVIVNELEMMAAEARKRAARIADPGRLPG